MFLSDFPFSFFFAPSFTSFDFAFIWKSFSYIYIEMLPLSIILISLTRFDNIFIQIRHWNKCWTDRMENCVSFIAYVHVQFMLLKVTQKRPSYSSYQILILYLFYSSLSIKYRQIIICNMTYELAQYCFIVKYIIFLQSQ